MHHGLAVECSGLILSTDNSMCSRELFHLAKGSPKHAAPCGPAWRPWGLVWLGIDGAIGMTAGITANSVALIGWGLDCAIQAVASLVIIWRFTGPRIHSDDAERTAQKVVAVSLFLLAPYIVVSAIDHLITRNAPLTNWLGIALAGTDALLMPLLGDAKKRVGVALGSHATTSEGRQNILCAYLSLGCCSASRRTPPRLVVDGPDRRNRSRRRGRRDWRDDMAGPALRRRALISAAASHNSRSPTPPINAGSVKRTSSQIA